MILQDEQMAHAAAVAYDTMCQHFVLEMDS